MMAYNLEAHPIFQKGLLCLNHRFKAKVVDSLNYRVEGQTTNPVSLDFREMRHDRCRETHTLTSLFRIGVGYSIESHAFPALHTNSDACLNWTRAASSPLPTVASECAASAYDFYLSKCASIKQQK